MRPINIVGIAPFNGLKLSMEHVAASFPSINFQSFIGDLEEGVDIVKALNPEEVDVVISRGGTALLLKKILSIPVIEIDISIYDIMRALRLAQDFNGKLAVVGFENITDRANVLNDLLDLNIDIIAIDAEDTAESVLDNLKKNGYKIIICDQITSTLARKIGLNAILIHSVEESIRKSFEQALNIGKTRAEIKEQNKVLKSLYKNSPVDILVFDQHNSLVEEYSSYSLPPRLMTKITHRHQTSDGSNIDPYKESLGGKLYTIEKKAVDTLDFTLYFVTPVTINSPSSKAVDLISINADEENQEILYNSSLSIGIETKYLKSYAQSKEAVFIVGEAGTGKDKLSRLIAIYSEKSRIWEIRCDLITQNEWNELYTSIHSPLQDYSSLIYFKEVSALSRKQLNHLLEYAKDSLLFKRNKILFSSTIRPNESTQDLVTLFNDWSIIFYTTTSLRDRKTDIPSIASLYINEYNNAFGKQIIGFEPKAIKRLTDYDWPLNQTQFRRVLKQLVIKTNSAYIKDIDTLNQLKDELGNSHTATSDVLQLDQTLEEINKDIIQLVLQEEKGNKTKTAQRLGISRSTLWRILAD